MKKYILVALFVLMSLSGLAQTPTAHITGNATGVTGALTSLYPVSLQVQVTGCGQEVPTVIPSGSVITNTYSQVAPQPTLAVNLQLYGNDIIQCGTQTYTTYAATWLINGFPAAPTAQYRVVQGGTCNISDGSCKPIGFIPPIISKAAGMYCPAATPVLNGFNADYTPSCSAAPGIPSQIVNQINGATGTVTLTGSGVSQAGNTFTFAGGTAGCTPSGADNSLLYKNGINCPAAQVSIDLTNDVTGGSIKIPKMSNLLSSNIGANGNPYWTDNSVFPQQIPEAHFYVSDYQGSNADFYASSVNDVTIFGSNRYSLASAGGYSPDAAVRYDKMYVYSPNQIGGAHNLQIYNFAHGDTVGHTDTVTARGCTEGFEECLERNRQFYGYGWFSPHGPITIGTTDYMHHYSVSVVPTNLAGTFGEDNYLIDETKKFVPAGNVTNIVSSTLLGNHFASLHADATLTASMNAKYGTTLHVATVVAGADEQKYNNACPSTVIGSWAPIVPYSPTSPTGTGMQTQNQCVTVSGDISTLTTGSVVCTWGDHSNGECAWVVSKPDTSHLVLSLNHQHDPGEYIVWGAGVGQTLTVPRGYVPRRTLDNNANLQEEDVVFTMPMIGWDSAHSEIILWPNYSMFGNNEVKLPIYTTNTPLVPMTVTGVTASGSFTSLTATPGGNYQTATVGAGAISFLPPPTLSFNCTVAPTYRMDPDQTVNVAAFTVTLLTGGSGCSNNTVTVNNTYANPVWIYPSLHLWRVRNNSLPANTQPSKLVDGGNMLVDAIPNLSDFTNGDIVRQQMAVNQYTTGNEQIAGSPAVQYSSRFGPMRTLQYMFPQGLNGSAAVDYTANATPGWYYWSDSAHNYMPSQDVTTNPLLGTGSLPYAFGLGGSWGGWMHATQPPYQKNQAGRVLGGTLILVDCTTPGQDGAGANGPCHDRNIFPKFDLMRVTAPDSNSVAITADVENLTIDVAANLTVGGKKVCKKDPITGAAIDCPVLKDYTMTLAAPPFTAAAGHFYEIGSLQFAVDNIDATKNSYYVPQNCNISRVDVTEYNTGAAPSSEGVQVNLLVNGTGSTIVAGINFPWNTSGMNHYNAVIGTPVAVTAGSTLTLQVNTPGWVTPPAAPVAVTGNIYCSVP